MFSAGGKSTTSEDVMRQRINLLTELHRPLEEHWKNGAYLDAKGSDHLYKHHISRLREIYTSHQLDPSISTKPPDDIANVIPVTQLYGTKGILTGKIEKTFKIREDRWDWRFAMRPPDRATLHDHHPTVTNHYSEKLQPVRDRSESPNTTFVGKRNSDLTKRPTSASYDTAGGAKIRQALVFGSIDNDNTQRRRPMSASASTPAVRDDGIGTNGNDRSGRGRDRVRDIGDDEIGGRRKQLSLSPKRVGNKSNAGAKKPPTAPVPFATSSVGSDTEADDKRYRCTQPGLSREDLTIIGQYRFSPEQDAIYQKFIEMLSHFDEYDQKHILLDAQKDCRQMTLLDAIRRPS